MSHTVPPLELVELVDDDEEAAAEVELSAGSLDAECATEVSDSAGPVAMPAWVTPPKLDAPPAPPQAQPALISARAKATRMET